MQPTEQIIISGFSIYLASIIYARFVGLRSYSKIATSDFAMTVAIGSMIATTTLSTKVLWWQGCLGMAVIFLGQYIIAKVRERISLFTTVLENSPVLIMRDGKFLEENMKKTRIKRQDVIAKLREANVLSLSEVRAVVFETTGDISVIHGSKDLESILLENVES